MFFKKEKKKRWKKRNKGDVQYDYENPVSFFFNYLYNGLTTPFTCYPFSLYM